MKSILGINYYFGRDDVNDSVFDPARAGEPVPGFVQAFKRWIEARYDVEVHTLDCIDPHSSDVKAVLYFDYSWRYARHDPYLRGIPFEKRALMIIEPENVNPSLYYFSRYRSMFSMVFTWDERLLAKNPDYKPVNVPVGAEPSLYRENRFADVAFDQKKLLVAVSRNRWSYMPQSTYKERKRAYSYFDANRPDDFDLYGPGWNEPAIFYERLCGYPRYQCYRGVIAGDWDAKVACMAKYKFALCFENNASQPGYISEKITDCLCARCVPVYYGSKGLEKRIPKECWIDARQFGDYAEMESFLVGMPQSRHAEYLAAIEGFMHSPELDFFSTEHYFRTLAEGLGLPRCSNVGET